MLLYGAADPLFNNGTGQICIGLAMKEMEEDENNCIVKGDVACYATDIKL